jgi:hypothetical protein
VASYRLLSDRVAAAHALQFRLCGIPVSLHLILHVILRIILRFATSRAWHAPRTESSLHGTLPRTSVTRTPLPRTWRTRARQQGSGSLVDSAVSGGGAPAAGACGAGWAPLLERGPRRRVAPPGVCVKPTATPVGVKEMLSLFCAWARGPADGEASHGMWRRCCLALGPVGGSSAAGAAGAPAEPGAGTSRQRRTEAAAPMTAPASRQAG